MKWPRRDSNPHAPNGTRDFKSRASAIPPLGRPAVADAASVGSALKPTPWSLRRRGRCPRRSAQHHHPAGRRPGLRRPGVHGSARIATPHIDSLAAGGVRCTNGYVSCPVCSPTRAASADRPLPAAVRPRVQSGELANGGTGQGLPTDERRSPTGCTRPGYATGSSASGTWARSRSSTRMPRGFDEFFGFLAGWPFLPDGATTRRRADLLHSRERTPLEAGYLTDALADEAVPLHRAAQEASRSSSTWRSTPCTRRWRRRRRTWSASPTSPTRTAAPTLAMLRRAGRRRRPRAGEAARPRLEERHADLLPQRQRRADDQVLAERLDQRPAARQQGRHAGKAASACRSFVPVEGPAAGRAVLRAAGHPLDVTATALAAARGESRAE